MNDEEEQQLDMEIKREREREYVGEYNDEMRRIWIKDNLDMLKDEFISYQEDDFNEYCNNAYNEVEE